MQRHSHWWSYSESLPEFMIFQQLGFKPEKLKSLLRKDIQKMREDFSVAQLFKTNIFSRVSHYTTGGISSSYVTMQTVLNELASVQNFYASGRRVFKVKHDLCQMLLNTEAKIPLSIFRAPAGCFYIDLPEGILNTVDAEYGQLIPLTGIYVTMMRVTNDPTRKDLQEIEFAEGEDLQNNDWHFRVTGVSRSLKDDILGHDWLIRFQSTSWRDNDERTIEALYTEDRDSYAKSVAEDKDQPTKDRERMVNDLADWRGTEITLIRLAANVCLYTQLPDPDIIEKPSQLLQQLEELKEKRVPAKQKKGHLKKVRRLNRKLEGKDEVHYFLLGSNVKLPDPTVINPTTENGEEGGKRKSPKPHWRDGSWAITHYGKGSKKDPTKRKSKLIWRQPILVRKAALSSDAGQIGNKTTEF